MAFKITSNSEAQVTSSNKAMGYQGEDPYFSESWALTLLFLSGVPNVCLCIVKDKLQDTGVYVAMHHCNDVVTFLWHTSRQSREIKSNNVIATR